jgi:hypothetical protein
MNGEPVQAFWRRLDTPGHDAARLEPVGSGWRLYGAAVWAEASAAAALSYELTLDADWRALRGRVQGFVKGRRVARTISREAGYWTLDGLARPEIEDCLDLDFGFTPATNLPTLRRLGLQIGEAAEFAVAWLDDAAETLTPLPQRYQRTGARTYAYQSPHTGYRAVLETGATGFAAEYPGLWRMEPPGAQRSS